jgi:LmbE family N-acetylglucosaminyl deacetylase
VDAAWESHEVAAVVFYFTTAPNLAFDVTATRERKHRAIGAYRSQLTPDDVERLREGLEAMERRWAEGESFSHGEALKVLPPGLLHVNLLPERV